MIMNFIVILIILGGAATWASKAKGFGLFSAFLALVCVIAAGAVAFGVWEPIAYLILEKTGTSGFGGFIGDNAWGIALIAPFAISLLILRVSVDLFVRKNLQFSDLANTVGGIVFGATSGFIGAGMVVLSLSFMRLPGDLLGYQTVSDQSGNMVADGGLWIPADKAVAGLYSHLSMGAFATDAPLAKLQPAVHQQGGMLRMTYEDASRVTIKPGDASVIKAYEVKGTIDALTADSFSPKKQNVLYPDGSKPSGGTLRGYVVRFGSGAKEKGGNVVITPGQVRLIGTNADGGTFAVHPIAAVAAPDGISTTLYRFRFDAKEPFIASVGGSSESYFGLEFMLPDGASPTHLLVKNIRIDVSGTALTAYKNVTDRDTAVRTRAIFPAGAAAAPSATSGGSTASSGGGTSGGAASSGGGGIVNIAVGSQVEGVSTNPILPLNININKSNAKGLDLGAENGIRGGASKFTKEETEARGLGKELRVDKFETTKDTGIVQLTLSLEGRRTLLGKSVEVAEDILPPLLIDDAGRSYEALGYVYREGGEIEISFKPEEPVRAMSQIPNLSKGKRDQTLILIFRPTKGVKITGFRLGSKEIARFEGGVPVI